MGPVVQMEMSGKDFFSSVDYFIPRSRSICNGQFSRGHYEELLCENVLNFGKQFRRCLNNNYYCFSILALVVSLFDGTGPFG